MPCRPVQHGSSRWCAANNRPSHPHVPNTVAARSFAATLPVCSCVRPGNCLPGRLVTTKACWSRLSCRRVIEHAGRCMRDTARLRRSCQPPATGLRLSLDRLRKAKPARSSFSALLCQTWLAVLLQLPVVQLPTCLNMLPTKTWAAYLRSTIGSVWLSLTRAASVLQQPSPCRALREHLHGL